MMAERPRRRIRVAESQCRSSYSKWCSDCNGVGGTVIDKESTIEFKDFRGKGRGRKLLVS